MTVDDVAEVLHKEPWYIRKLAREGKIHGIKIIQPWFFCKDEIADMIDVITNEEIKKNKHHPETNKEINKHHPETERLDEEHNKGCDIFS